MLKANGRDLYFPQSPPSIGSHLAEDCAIPLGHPGNTTKITIPQIAGGRICKFLVSQPFKVAAWQQIS